MDDDEQMKLSANIYSFSTFSFVQPIQHTQILRLVRLLLLRSTQLSLNGSESQPVGAL